MNSTAENLMMNAKAFVLSADMLRDAPDPKHHLTILHLCSLSLELSLKAWIVHKGGTQAEIRYISHDLEKAYSKALTLGLSDQSGRLGQALAIIAPIYRADYTRYFPDIDGFNMLATDDLVEVAKAVAQTVEPFIWP